MSAKSVLAKVFISGCFDMLHAGHVEFFQGAAALGDQLYVALGCDQTVYDLKGRPPANTEAERCFMVQNVGCVHQALISSGCGYLDFEPELRAIQPDIFVVNEDGNTPDKRKLVVSLGIEYVVLQRTPHDGFLPRSTTDLGKIDQLPYRIDLAGGWLDQSLCLQTSSQFGHHPLHRTHARIQRTQRGAYRQGAWATSNRRTAIDLWRPKQLVNNHHTLAYMLFFCANPPGTEEISGAQDTIGPAFPDLARSDYDGAYRSQALEWKLSGDGSCGYLVLVIEQSIETNGQPRHKLDVGRARELSGFEVQTPFRRANAARSSDT